MNSGDPVGLVGAVGLLAIMLLGYWVMVRRLLPGGSREGSRGLGTGLLNRVIGSFLGFAVLYRFGFELYAGRLLDLRTTLLIGAVLLGGMAFFKWVETAVAVTGLTLFMMNGAA